MTLEGLSEKSGYSTSHISRLESGKRRLSVEVAEKLAVSLSCTTAEIMLTHTELAKALVDRGLAEPVDIQLIQSALPLPQPTVKLPRLEEMLRDVPVRGTARGGTKGSFTMDNADPVDYVRRPPGIVRAKDVYCIYVEGDSMEPRFQEGELVYIHPGRKIKVGDCVVIQKTNGENDPIQAFIKRLKRRTASKLVLEQFNPQATIEMPEESILSVHLILTMNELFGV
jgi:phage repressor protein C with HTH and peptisase S24 domain